MRSAARRIGLVLCAAALLGADWPGRERELATQMEGAPPARRIEVLTEIAASPGRGAEDAVVRGLRDPDPSVRMAAADLIARHRFGSGRDALVAWLSEPQPDVRAAGARALGQIGDARALPPLIRLLGDADVHVRLSAVDAVALLGGPDATVPLLDRLADAESSVRMSTARALGDLGDPRAVLSLLGALQDSMPEVREATATALGKLHDPRAVRGLLGLLHDPAPEVRLAATRALGVLGSHEAVIDLAPLALRDERGADPLTRPLARAAIDAIGRIGGPEAASVLVRAFRRSEADPELQRAAADALAMLGPEARASVPALAAAPVPPALQTALIELLGRIGGPESASALLSMYDALIGTHAIDPLLQSLGRTGTPEALRALLRAASATGEEAGANLRGSARALLLEPRRRGAIAGLMFYAEAHHGLDPGALDPLVSVLRTASEGLSGDAVHEFMAHVTRLVGATHNPRAPRVLAPLLSSEHADVRAAAAHALAQVGVSGVEPAVAAALGDPLPDVRLGAADALGRFGDRVAFDALVAAWNGARPIDRASAARAIGRIGGRTHDPRAASLLASALDTAAPGLASALYDALGYIAHAGNVSALAALTTGLAPGGPRLPVIEAIANALDAASEPTGSQLRGRVESMVRSEDDPDVRATAVWALGHLGGGEQHAALAALDTPSFAVTANAAGALARMYAAGAHPDPNARTALCAVLDGRHHPLVRSNVLLALAAGSMVCDAENQRRILLDGRLAIVRSAAARSLLVVLRSHPDADTARSLQSALEQCARVDRSAEVAAACGDALHALAASGAPTQTAPSAAPGDDPDRVLDAVVIADDEEHVADHVPFALVMADGVARLGRTGPTGWIHERPAPRGTFVVLDPDSMPLEP